MKHAISLLTLMSVISPLLLSPVTADSAPQPFWRAGANPVEEPQDTHSGFRGGFELTDAGEVEIRFIGATFFNLWLDGGFVADGPARFPREHPEYDTLRVKLPAGRHVLAAQVTHAGVDSRIMNDLPPFFACNVLLNDEPVKTEWKALRFDGVRSAARRRGPFQGWIEWIHTGMVPAGWQQPGFDDSAWPGVGACDPGIGAMKPLGTAGIRPRSAPFQKIAEGPLARRFAPVSDDPPVSFFLANLECKDVPPQGVWRRYDLGKVRIARPRFTLDLPPGAVVIFGGSEDLTDGRVAPWAGLSGSPTCFMDYYIARGGVQEFMPLQSQGARFFEVHVFAPPAAVRFVKEDFIERAYFGEPLGSFQSGDPLLDEIWKVGLETVRSSSEDALVDSRRERAQWTGDLFVAMRILAPAYPDLRLAKRGMRQSAQCADARGIVSALAPGMPDYLPGYSALWVGAVLDYWELTGDRQILDELFTAATRNVDGMLAKLGPGGVEDGLGWNFIDWGYVPNPGVKAIDYDPDNPAKPFRLPVYPPGEAGREVVFNLQFLEALRAIIRWCGVLEKDASRYQAAERQLTADMRKYFTDELARGGDAWRRIGYHRAVFGLRTGLLEGDHATRAVAEIKRFILAAFPNNPDAPRLFDPYQSGDFYTPYFANFSLAVLAERGEMDFVLDQYRRSWGWLLKQGLTTWPEVFDTHWSHCHQWSGSPTWMLSQQVLGLRPRNDRGENHFDFRIRHGGLAKASGEVALRNGQTARVSWNRDGNGVIDCEIDAPCSIWLKFNAESAPVEIHGREKFRLDAGTGLPRQ
jgi:hypothetical protein